MRPIPGELLRLALPVFASQLLRVAYQWVDALWVRGLGVEATAAVTTSTFVIWTMYSLNDVFSLGLVAYVSQLLGSGDRARAGVAAAKGLRASALMGLICSAIAIFGARSIFRFMHADPLVVERGASYLSVVIGAAPIPMMALTCEGIMRASGDTRTPFLIDLAAVALNAVLAPIFIYGRLGLPAMGVAGAAWATVIAQAALLGGYLAMAARRHRAFPLARRAPGAPVRILGMARVGLPTAIVGLSFSIVYIAFSRSGARFGAASLAIVGIANRIEAIQFVNAIAIGAAGAALVGQNIGAGRPDRAVQVVRTGIGWILWISLTLTVAFILFPHAFISLFTNDPEVHRVGVPYLRALALCLPFTGLEIVTTESIIGSGHTAVLSWIFIAFSAIRIPLAFLIPDWTHSGVTGIAWLITVTCALRATLIGAWAARGTWKRGLGELHG